MLIEQPSLDRCPPGADPPAKLLPADAGSVWADVTEVGVQQRPAETPPVAQRESAAVLELNYEAVPARYRGRPFEDNVARHPEVQPQSRAVLGLEPEKLPPPVGADQLMADQSVGNLSGSVGPADIGVAVINGGDPPAEHLLERLSGALGLGQFGHEGQVSGRLVGEAGAGSPPSAAAFVPHARAQ